MIPHGHDRAATIRGALRAPVGTLWAPSYCSGATRFTDPLRSAPGEYEISIFYCCYHVATTLPPVTKIHEHVCLRLISDSSELGSSWDC